VEEAGFRAEWATGTRLPLVRRSLGGCRHGGPSVHATAIGVDLLEAVPTYRMVSRASKYTAFFLLLTFVTCALFELTARIRLHPLQYGLLGASVVLAGVLTALFGFLHVVLSLEAYALLVGTPALFLVLSVVMAATRHVRWAA
jgi:inner membrane protein